MSILDSFGTTEFLKKTSPKHQRTGLVDSQPFSLQVVQIMTIITVYKNFTIHV